MIFITGDTHNDKTRFSLFDQFPENKRPGKGDTLIVCGDFGYVYRTEKGEAEFLDELAALPYTVCFCDGNHEDFTALASYPEEIWCGGKIHRIRPNIIHLMRGEIFTIEEKSFFAMGGAYSIDKATKLLQGQWWAEELPSNREYETAIRNLTRHAKKLDYVISHTAPLSAVRKMGFSPDMHEAELCGFLDWVLLDLAPRGWFFGHWHRDEVIDEALHGLWFDTVIIGENGAERIKFENKV